MDKKKHLSMNVGISWILVIFILLCLVTFGVLSMVSANSDYQMSKKTADRVTAFYEASSRAQDVLKQIDQELAASFSDGSFPQSALAKLAKDQELADSHSLSVSKENTISFSETLSDTQALSVSLETVQAPAQGEQLYRITCWQVVSTVEWDYEDTGELFNGTLE